MQPEPAKNLLRRRKKSLAQDAKSKWQVGELGLTSDLPDSSGHIFPLHNSVYQHQTSALAGVMIRSGSRGKPSFLINLFSLNLLALFFVLIWNHGLFEQCVYFQGIFQLSIKMTCQASLLCQVLDTLYQPSSSLEGLCELLMLTFLIWSSDMTVTAVWTTLFLFCVLLSTPPN